MALPSVTVSSLSSRIGAWGAGHLRPLGVFMTLDKSCVVMRGCLTAKFRIPIHASPSRSGFATSLGVDHVVQGPAANMNHGHWRPVDRVLGWHLSQENVLRKTRYKDGEGIVISLSRHPSPSNTVADLTFFPRIQLQHSRVLSFGVRLSRSVSYTHLTLPTTERV